MLVNISFQLDTDVPEDVAKLRKIVGLETTPETAPAQVIPSLTPDDLPAKVAPKVKAPTPAAEVFPAHTQPALIPEPREALPGSVSLREQAKTVATELVTTGQSQRVRDALGEFGAKRVSDLKDDQLEAFLVAVA